MSRYHCAIDIKDSGAYLRDLFSTNGTLVNGNEIEKKTELLKGDRLQIGDAVFTVLSSETFKVAEVEKKPDKDETGGVEPVKNAGPEKNQEEEKPVIKINRGVTGDPRRGKPTAAEADTPAQPAPVTKSVDKHEEVSEPEPQEPEPVAVEPEPEEDDLSDDPDIPESPEEDAASAEEPEEDEDQEDDPEEEPETPIPSKPQGETTQSLAMIKIVAGTVIAVMILALIIKLIPSREGSRETVTPENTVTAPGELKQPEAPGNGSPSDAGKTPQQLLRELDAKFKKELAAIIAYAEENPDDVKDIQARYQKLADNYKGTFYEERAQKQLEEYIRAYKKAKEDAFRKKLSEVETLRAQKRFYLALKRCTEIYKEPELPDDAQDRLKKLIGTISSSAEKDYRETIEQSENLVKEEAYEDAAKLLRKKADTLGMFSDELLLTLNVPPFSEKLIEEADRVGEIMWENYEKKRRTMERVQERIVMLLKQRDFARTASYLEERIGALKSPRLSKELKRLLPVTERLADIRKTVIGNINNQPVQVAEFNGTVLKADERTLTVRDEKEGREINVSWRSIRTDQLLSLFDKTKAVKNTGDKKALSDYFFIIGEYNLSREFSVGIAAKPVLENSFTGMPLRTFRSGQEWGAWGKFNSFMVFPDPGSQTSSAYAALNHYGISGGMVHSAGSSEAEGSDSAIDFIVQDCAGDRILKLNDSEAENAFHASMRNPDAHPSLVRPRCYNNPAVWKELTQKVSQSVNLHKNGNPAGYSLSSYVSSEWRNHPADWCYCEFCTDRFRKHLESVYGNIGDLNASWNTAFGSFAEIMPRSLHHTIRENNFFETRWAERDMRYPELAYAPYNDFREWRDLNFAAKLKELSDQVRREHPGVPAGIMGLPEPSAFGGFDYSLLPRSCNFAGYTFDSGQSEILRSFTQSSFPRILDITIDNNVPQSGKFQILYHFFHGGRGVVLHSMDRAYTSGASRQPREALPFIKEALELTQSELGKAILSADFRTDKIGIYYSQPSIRFHWLIDSGISRESWPDKLDKISGASISAVKAMNSFAEIIENSGYQYTYISSRSVAEHGISPDEYKVVILPKTVSLSEKEADALTAYVKAGGRLVADYQTGMVDEHLNGRSEGILDRLFGIRRKNYTMVEWFESLGEATSAGIGLSKPIKSEFRNMMAVEEGLVAIEGEPQADAGGVPVVIVNSWGSGKTFYLNLNILNYDDVRFADVTRGERMRIILDNILKDSGLAPAVEVYREDGTFYPNIESLIWNTPEEEYLVVMQNPRFFMNKGVTAIEPDINGKPHPIHIKLTSGPREIYRWRDKTSLGKKDLWKDLFIPHQPLVYVVR